MNKKNGFIALISTAAIFGGFGVLIRMLAETFSNTGSVLARSLTASIVIIGIVLFKKINPLKLEKQQWKYVLFFSIVFPISLLCFTFSANSIKVSNSLFMLYVGSLASTAILGRVLFKEKFTPIKIISLVFVIIGLSFFVYPFDIKTISLGLVLGILAGVCEGGSHTLRKLMGNMKREVIVFYQSVSAVIVSIFFFSISNEVFIKNFSTNGLIVAIVFGVLLVVIGYLLAYGFGNFDVNLGTVILAAELFFALIVNAIFLKEYPTLYETIGGVIIFLAAALPSLKLKPDQAI
jgi:drug/metabolite transporter, DME family